jgi:phosphopantetheinyl transferase
VLPSHTREPIVYSPAGGFPAGVQVSISHSGEFAGAVARLGDQFKIGFDLERVGTVDPVLYQLAFRDSEIRQIERLQPTSRPVAALVLWTAKEAISKATGTGLSICLQDIELDPPDGFLEEDVSSLRLSACLRQPGPRFTVHSCRRGDYVLSLACPSEAGGGQATSWSL